MNTNINSLFLFEYYYNTIDYYCEAIGSIQLTAGVGDEVIAMDEETGETSSEFEVLFVEEDEGESAPTTTPSVGLTTETVGVLCC